MPLVGFSIIGADLHPISINIIFLQSNVSYCFFSSCWQTWVSSVEVKYDIFINGDEGPWQKHMDWHSQHKIVDSYPSSMSQTSLQTEEAFAVKEYKHTHNASGSIKNLRKSSVQTICHIIWKECWYIRTPCQVFKKITHLLHLFWR